MRGQDRPQVRGRRRRIHRRSFGHNFLSRLHSERAIEVGLGPARITRDNQRLTSRFPTRHRGRLQIQRRFVFCQNDCVRCVLGRVDQFF